MSSGGALTAIAWHAASVADVRTALAADARGLTHTEAHARRARAGANVIASREGHHLWRTAARQFRGTLVLLLVVAAVVAILTRELFDAAAIAVVLLLNAALGFATEYQAHRAVRGLRDLDPRRAFAMRDGQPTDIDARDLVPGDVLLLEEGIVVAADARVTDAVDLRSDESLLTGESMPVPKNADAVHAAAPVAERHSIVHAGTTIVAGAGRAVVVRTGNDTELGTIGRLVGAVQPPRPPIERRLEQLGRTLAGAAVAVIAVLAALGAVRGAPLLDLLETSVALAVAAIPEALPAVATVALAIGAVRMARRNVIVRRLAAIESLGATTTVCVDKTGTLTGGRMTLVQLAGPEWCVDPGDERAAADPRVHRALVAGAMASPAGFGAGASTTSREPTDVAFLAAAAARNVARPIGRTVLALPFRSQRMFAATIAEDGDRLYAWMKGAPREVLARCERIATPSGDVQLGASERAAVERVNADLAERGLRVLAVADGRVRHACEGDLRGLTLVCLAALSDPVVPGAREAILVLRDAGVRVVMLTGDQVRTASAIGRELGLGADDAAALDAGQVSRLGSAALRERLAHTHVVARVTPEEKLRVVEALQEGGEVVGVFGDGVNDAPALRRADVGVAMGRRGSDVAKESAEIVLRDDRLESLRDAVYEGRVIFDNIRSAVTYLLACNVAELLFLLLASLAGAPLLFTPLQLLWLNLVTDTFPALALALERGHPGVMRRPPNVPGAALVGAREWRRITVSATAMALATIGAWATLSSLDEAGVRTGVFATLALAQLLHVPAVRAASATPLRQRLRRARWAIGAGAVSGVLLAAAIWLPALARVMRMQPMSARAAALVVGWALVPSLVSRWRRPAADDARSRGPRSSARDQRELCQE